MRVRRGLLFWGLLLIPLGAIPLLVRSGAIDGSRLGDAWRFWPLILIGIGLAVLASRTRFALIGTVVAALTIGTIGGAAVANGSVWLGALGSCGLGSSGTTAIDKAGTFGETAAVRVALDCGSLDFRAGSATGWTVHGTYRDEAPVIDAATNHLDIQSPSGGDHRQDWNVVVPAVSLRTLDVTANAATTTIDLGSATLDDLHADVNAGDVRLAAASATVAQIGVTMNAGRLRLTLGGKATQGTLSVNAGAIDLCVPPDAGLRLDVEEQLTFVTNLSSRGLTHNGSTWIRSGTSVIDLSVSGNAASFNLNPNGGC